MTTKKNSKRKFSQDFSGESKTQQHFQASCDVNNIVAAFQTTGLDPRADRVGKESYGFATSQDFSEAMQNIAEINSGFAELPSEERQAFSNDPVQWIDSLATPIPPDDPIVDSEAPEEPLVAPKSPDSEPN